MIYVLIMLTVGYGPSTHISVATQEFNSARSCETAGMAFVSMERAYTHLFYECTPK